MYARLCACVIYNWLHTYNTRLRVSIKMYADSLNSSIKQRIFPSRDFPVNLLNHHTHVPFTHIRQIFGSINLFGSVWYIMSSRDEPFNCRIELFHSHWCCLSTAYTQTYAHLFTITSFSPSDFDVFIAARTPCCHTYISNIYPQIHFAHTIYMSYQSNHKRIASYKAAWCKQWITHRAYDKSTNVFR